MTDDLTCAEAAERGYPERYAAGTLDDDSVERFESHFLTCEHCQEAVELAAAVRGASRRRRARLGGYAGAGGFALAAAVVVFAVLHVRGVDSVRALGVLRIPPAYGGAAVRGALSADDSSFDTAMSAYGAGRYRAAAAQLGSLHEREPQLAPVDFFLGASLLMNGQLDSAGAAFARVVRAAPNPYVGEAHYYRALALLQSGRPDSAAAELRSAAAAGSPVAARAQDLLARLEARRTP